MSAIDIFLTGIYCVEVVGTVGVVAWIIHGLVQFLGEEDRV